MGCPQQAGGESVQRARARDLREAWPAFLGPLGWEYFATLTFDPKRVFPVSRALADREAHWWCGLLGRLCHRAVGWLYALERGAGGLWHAHALVIGAKGLNWRLTADLWQARNGRSGYEGRHREAGKEGRADHRTPEGQHRSIRVRHYQRVGTHRPGGGSRARELLHRFADRAS